MELVDMRDLGFRAFSVWVRVPSGAPSRSKRYKACSDFFQKSEEYLRTKVFEETVLANIEVIAAQNQVSMINSKII